MEKYYITFGSSEKFPFQNTYMIVAAKDERDASQTYRDKYPDVNEGYYNFSDIYSEQTWNSKVGQYYKDKGPAEILYSPNCFGEKPGGYGEIYVFVREAQEILYIKKGAEICISDKDRKNGYIDLVWIQIYDMKKRLSNSGSGQILLKESFEHTYESTADCIPDVLMKIYNAPLMDCQILC